MATHGYQLDSSLDDDAGSRRMGWILFAVTMLALSGAVGVINGIVALSKSSFYVSDAQYVFSDLHTWGWIILVLSCFSLLAAFTVMGGSNFGRWCGILVAGLNAIAQLLFVQSYPIWSLVVFGLDVLVIYALAVYGGARLRDL